MWLGAGITAIVIDGCPRLGVEGAEGDEDGTVRVVRP